MVEEIKKTEGLKGADWQRWTILILVLIVLVETIVFSASLKASEETIKKMKTTSQVMAQRIEQADAQINALEQEKARCGVILTKPAGEFADYEYCKKLLQKFPL